jgi:hypothetical protein
LTVAGEETFGNQLPAGRYVGDIVSIDDQYRGLGFNLMLDVLTGPDLNRAIELGLAPSYAGETDGWLVDANPRVRTLRIARDFTLRALKEDTAELVDVNPRDFAGFVDTVHAHRHLFFIEVVDGAVAMIEERYNP